MNLLMYFISNHTYEVNFMPFSTAVKSILMKQKNKNLELRGLAHLAIDFKNSVRIFKV